MRFRKVATVSRPPALATTLRAPPRWGRRRWWRRRSWGGVDVSASAATCAAAARSASEIEGSGKDGECTSGIRGNIFIWMRHQND